MSIELHTCNMLDLLQGKPAFRQFPWFLDCCEAVLVVKLGWLSCPAGDRKILLVADAVLAIASR